MAYQQQPQEDYYETYDYGEDEDVDFQQKRKRLASKQPAGKSDPRVVVEIIKWGVVGTVGFIMTIGSAIASNNDPGGFPHLVIPLIYMIAAMYFLRR